MKISIVIPVYNEAEQLNACLDAIALQSVKPHEVIVVDNNSTDTTASLARSYSFVTLLIEARQGVVHARTRGFNAASGDIIARIDGDSILPEDWVASVQSVISNPEIDAVSGVALYYNIASSNVLNAIDLFFRRRLSKHLYGNMYLWGANMAIRRSSWKKVKDRLCEKGDMHEDFDIAIHLQELGCNVVFDERLRAKVSSRRIDMNYLAFMRYVYMSPNTYAQHGIKVGRQLYPVVLVCALGYLPGRILYRGYDPINERFSLTRLLSSTSELSRVDPTLNVA